MESVSSVLRAESCIVGGEVFLSPGAGKAEIREDPSMINLENECVLGCKEEDLQENAQIQKGVW